eukprot:g17546.t1
MAKAAGKKRGGGKNKGFFKKAGGKSKKKGGKKKKVDAEDQMYKKLEGKARELQRIEKAIGRQDRRLEKEGDDGSEDSHAGDSGSEDQGHQVAQSAYEKLLEQFQGGPIGAKNGSDKLASGDEYEGMSAGVDEDDEMDEFENEDADEDSDAAAQKGAEIDEAMADETIDLEDQDDEADVAEIRRRTLHGDDEAEGDEIETHDEVEVLEDDAAPSSTSASAGTGGSLEVGKRAAAYEIASYGPRDNYSSFRQSSLRAKVDFDRPQRQKLHEQEGHGNATAATIFSYAPRATSAGAVAEGAGAFSSAGDASGASSGASSIRPTISSAPARPSTFSKQFVPLLKGYDAKITEKCKWRQNEYCLFDQLNSYRDVILPGHTAASSKKIRSVYLMHVLNHVMKAREEVVSNNTTIAKIQAAEKEKADGEQEGDEHSPNPKNKYDDEFMDRFAEKQRDQGFCRARVLILCPYRSIAYELVELLQKMCPNAKQVLKKPKFDDQFAPGPDAIEGGESLNGTSSGAGDEAQQADAKAWNNETARDLQNVFSGNNDDKFRLGIAVSRRSLKLFTPFYQSDILICSPLGLRLITGAEGERNREYDFLSSLECVVLDRMDVMKYQNLDHVLDALKVCNLKPKKLPDGCDIGRLRSCFASNESRLLRQTIVTSNGNYPELSGMLMEDVVGATAGSSDSCQEPKTTRKKRNRRDEHLAVAGSALDVGGAPVDSDHLQKSDEICIQTNYRGAVKFSPAISCDRLPMELSKTQFAVDRQMFLLHRSSSGPSSLFRTFEKQFWRTTGTEMEYLVVVVSGSGYRYADFFRMRKFFEGESVDHIALDEYSDWVRVKEARLNFNKGNVRVLLLTERFLFYHPDFDIRNAQNLFFYGTPEKSYLLGLSWLSPYTKSADRVFAGGAGGGGNGAVLTLVDAENDECAVERILGPEFVKKKMKKFAGVSKLFTFT